MFHDTTRAAAARCVDADRFLGNCEPDLEDMFEDDIVRHVMARDGVAPDQVRSLLNLLRNRPL